MLRVRLPPSYPAVPPHLELSCPGAAAAALEVARAQLCALAAAAASCEDGEECGAALAQRFVDLAAGELTPPPPAAAPQASASASASDDVLEEAVVLIERTNAPTRTPTLAPLLTTPNPSPSPSPYQVLIDHMNDHEARLRLSNPTLHPNLICRPKPKPTPTPTPTPKPKPTPKP